jgi:molecular chaperone Hsp33
MHDRDSLHRFLFERYPIRGHLVHLDATWRALLEHRDYPPNIRDTLGEAVASSVLLAATLKFEGTLSLQLQGDGPMHLMIAQCTSGLGVRAVARTRGEPTARDLPSLAGEGRLSVTLENEDLTQRYQGVVPLAGERMAQCLESYFATSEQLPTRLWLHADGNGASGMLLQRVPEASEQRATVTHDPAEIEDAWRRVQLIGDTLQPDELAQLSDREILRRLFNEDDVRLFQSTPVFFRCRCSRERVVGMLQSLGEPEIRSVLEEQGRVEVRCDFCNRAYQFDSVDIGGMFKAASSLSDGASRLH